MRIRNRKWASPLFIISLAVAGLFGVTSAVIDNQTKETPVVEKADAAISKSVTRVYIEDQVNSNTTLLSIEYITFDSNGGYGHTQWRAFLTSYLGARSSYNTSSGSPQPTTKGWSYMSDSQTEKYLLCVTGSKNFTMVFPEWVTEVKYKAVGNNFWNWFDVGGNPVDVHSGWGIGKKINSYIYNSGGWKMNANLDNTSQTNTWGDVTISAIARCTDTSSQIDSKSITMSKYYVIANIEYGDIVGYNKEDHKWYSNEACTSEISTTLVTANRTAYAKYTLNKHVHLAGTMNNWSTTDDNYWMKQKSSTEYSITVLLQKDTEFKVVLDSTWYGWDQVDGSSGVVTSSSIGEGSDPDERGTRIKVLKAGRFNIYFHTDYGSNKIWFEFNEVDTYAKAFLAAITCDGAGSHSFNINVWNNVSGTGSMEYKYNHLSSEGKAYLTSLVGTIDENASPAEQTVARYDFILRKYGYGTASGQYHDFMSRNPSSKGAVETFSPFDLMISSDDNSSTIIIIIASSVALLSMTALSVLIVKKKKSKETN